MLEAMNTGVRSSCLAGTLVALGRQAVWRLGDIGVVSSNRLAARCKQYLVRSGLGGHVRPDPVAWRRLGLRRSRTTHQDKRCRSSQDTSFLRFSVMTHMSRHIVVALIPSAPLLTDTRRSTVGPGTREDVAVLVVEYIALALAVSAASALVMEHIALAPAAIAAPVSVAEHIAPFLQWSQRLCLLGVHRAPWLTWCPCWRHSRCAPAAKVFAKVEMHAESKLPALEKFELVERLVRALELGQFLEEYEDSRDALVLFARRLTHHLDAIGERWLHVARIKPLCALRAAGLVARSQLQQMNDSATSQSDGMRASRDDHVEAHRQQEVRRWTSVLGVVHTEVLGQLGLAHTDPEHCFYKSWGGRLPGVAVWVSMWPSAGRESCRDWRTSQTTLIA